MNKLQRLLCMLLSLLLLMQAPLAALAEDEVEGAEETAAAETEEIEIPEELVVAHPTITKGDFFTEMFGNDTADIDVRALIHGYNLVNWDQNQGVYVLDPSVVVDWEIDFDEYGNKRYLLVLNDNLRYSDGTPITAWDYAFSMLLMMSPQIEEIGGKIYRAEHIFGYDEYITGESKGLVGVDVISDHQLMIILDHDFLPYFFEVGLLLCVPYPIHVIAPGCKVASDGYGVYITNEDPAVEEPLYTADLLRKTILDPDTGYNTHPSVVSGPYTITGWDGVTGHFEINPEFQGAWYHNTLPGDPGFPEQAEVLLNAEGNPILDKEGNEVYVVKPTIEKIAFTEADNDTLIEKLQTGEFHLVNKVTYGPTILKGMGTMQLDPEEIKEKNLQGIRMTPYPRIGLAFLTFTYDWPTVNSMKVRQAIAWCMDRDKLTNLYCGRGVEGLEEERQREENGEDEEEGATGGQSWGVRVDGYYGIEQWEYLLVTGALDYPINFIDDPMQTGANGEKEDLTKKYHHRYVTNDSDYEKAVAAWEALSLDNLTVYTVDLEKATHLLEEDGWTLNRNGEAFVPGTDDVRCKMIDDNLVALDLKMMYPEGNHMAELMEEYFVPNLNAVGIKLEMVPAPMQELLSSYYRESPRTTDMIYLATNFHVIVDPSITYSTDTTKNHQIWNNTYSDDEDLWYRAVNMRKTEPGDVYDYVSKWVSFQERYNEVLPTIPIYSNIYYDFYNEHLQDYYVTGQVTWSQAILLSYFGLPKEAPEEEEAELDDGEMEIMDD